MLAGGVARSLVIPVPLIQIASDAIAGLIPQLEINLDSDVFFLLLVPPLLFIDGWRIPVDELGRDRWAILQMAFGLVVATVLLVGSFIAWLVPVFPLGAAFALAAALAPTDPIAVTSIARRVPIPRRMMNLLQAESLLNDATGLICLRFAVVFLLTRGFSWSRPQDFDAILIVGMTVKRHVLLLLPQACNLHRSCDRIARTYRCTELKALIKVNRARPCQLRAQ